MWIIDASERFTTTLLETIYPTDYMSDIEYEDGRVYLLDWEKGLIILDPTDPVNPVEIGRWAA